MNELPELLFDYSLTAKIDLYFLFYLKLNSFASDVQWFKQFTMTSFRIETIKNRRLLYKRLSIWLNCWRTLRNMGNVRYSFKFWKIVESVVSLLRYLLARLTVSQYTMVIQLLNFCQFKTIKWISSMWPTMGWNQAWIQIKMPMSCGRVSNNSSKYWIKLKKKLESIQDVYLRKFEMEYKLDDIKSALNTA